MTLSAASCRETMALLSAFARSAAVPEVLFMADETAPASVSRAAAADWRFWKACLSESFSACVICAFATAASKALSMFRREAERESA